MFSRFFKKGPQKELKSAAIITEPQKNLDSSYYSYQSHNNNASFCNNPATPLETKHSDAETAEIIPLNQNFSSIFNVPKQNNVVFMIFLRNC